MKDKLVLFALLAILVLGGIVLFANITKNSDSIKELEEDKNIEEKEIQVSGESGFYKSYSPEVLAEAAGTRRVLFFYANWCPTCRPVDAELREKTSEPPSDLTVIRVNYNDSETDEEEKALAKKYGITYQHTFVQIDDGGSELTKWNGGSLDQLLTNLK